MPRKTLIQVRRDTATNWSTVDPVLASGEMGYETDTNKIKVGDGSTSWSSLSYTNVTTGAAYSVLGRAGTTSGVLADIVASSNGHVLRRTASGLGFGQVTSDGIENGAILTEKIGLNQVTADRLASGVIKPSEAVFTIPGALSTGARNARFYVEGSRTISNVVVSVGTAPTGASVILDVNKNGTTIFSTQANRPTIDASGFYDGSSTPDVTSLSAGDYLTVDVDQVGSSVPGSDAVIRIIF
jgi:hypothetical protein